MVLFSSVVRLLKGFLISPSWIAVVVGVDAVGSVVIFVVILVIVVVVQKDLERFKEPPFISNASAMSEDETKTAEAATATLASESFTK
mmetsp:Transcript_10243/g.18925  ORF Transcript_10243/g.18925 Transcript_10243/m.18925 type:complete len:88 (-) Transcript_10243:402-665(-)|eukprot:CAMPEP_0175069290 /NCGR_PEP_ID=MMETSP0052_2-20121109/18118_1 /TAXON_ID=51329 ORGANISM="Polytomella parva, Strain SAG 63-3" /NCGR_SAMPLE_ID=MMETSP0052_2 /ASSEMBLY_ACC=CAM_ASM_000194 /LENGTH=87 /DNA_ID=CAMNT_0016336359 /DNA_START=1034 /DNA_END=1297 /DNA_ORIENTATION=+